MPNRSRRRKIRRRKRRKRIHLYAYIYLIYTGKRIIERIQANQNQTTIYKIYIILIYIQQRYYINVIYTTTYTYTYIDIQHIYYIQQLVRIMDAEVKTFIYLFMQRAYTHNRLHVNFHYLYGKSGQHLSLGVILYFLSPFPYSLALACAWHSSKLSYGSDSHYPFRGHRRYMGYIHINISVRLYTIISKIFFKSNKTSLTQTQHSLFPGNIPKLHGK